MIILFEKKSGIHSPGYIQIWDAALFEAGYDSGGLLVLGWRSFRVARVLGFLGFGD